MTQVFDRLYNKSQHSPHSTQPGQTGPNSWLAAYRLKGWDAFKAKGLPDRTWEDWRYFSLRSLKDLKDSLSLTETAAAPPTEELRREVFKENLIGMTFLKKALIEKGILKIGDFESHIIVVCLNGNYLALGITDRSVSVETLATMPPERYVSFEKNFSYQQPSGEAFYHLNSAFITDGVFISVTATTETTKPTIHVINVMENTTGADTCQAFFPRLGIHLKAGAEVSLIESYIGLRVEETGTEPYLCVPVTQVLLDPGSKLNHVRIQHDAPLGMHIGSTQKTLMADSVLKSFSLSSHGPLYRHDLRIALKAKNAFAQFDGLFLVKGSQLVDHHTTVDHQVPDTQSRQLYHGIISDHGRGIFNGKVLVRAGAHGTDARQTNKNLILSSDAEIDTKPELQIDADDVKCSHGAAIGQIDPEHLLYLQARGIPEATARKMLLQAFAHDCLERFPVASQPLSQWVNHQVMEYFAS